MEDFSKSIIPEWESITGTINTNPEWGIDLINTIFVYVKDSIFGLLAVITIWLFIYIGWKLVKADWNPEEMKKAFMNLVHIIIGLFIIAVSFALVKMVSGLNF
jgi:TRAP-type mannitol/chloroaromatic compound transport system permease small subunit